MLSAHDLKTCREVSQVFRQAVEETNQRRLAECRDNSLLCSELQTRMREHCFQVFQRDISPTALYWHTFHWMQTFVNRDNVLNFQEIFDSPIELANGDQSLRALCTIDSNMQESRDQFLFRKLKQHLVKGNFVLILEQVNQQTTSLDIIRLLMQCADTDTNSLVIVRGVLADVLETRNQPCLLEILKFNHLNLVLDKKLFELACAVGCREIIDLSLQMGFDCGFALRSLGGTKLTPGEVRFGGIHGEELHKENISRLGGHLDSLRTLINSKCFQRAPLGDIATSFEHALVLSHSTCASMIFGTNRFLSVPNLNYFLDHFLNSVLVSNLFTALRVTGQINHLSRDHLQFLHELATHFNIPDAGIAVAAPAQPLMAEVAALPPNADVAVIEEPVTERIPHRSICTPTVIAAASICAILSIGVALLNSLQ
jgi:hypothetical protein